MLLRHAAIWRQTVNGAARSWERIRAPGQMPGLLIGHRLSANRFNLFQANALLLARFKFRIER